jgi:hypothetical protein
MACDLTSHQNYKHSNKIEYSILRPVKDDFDPRVPGIYATPVNVAKCMLARRVVPSEKGIMNMCSTYNRTNQKSWWWNINE